MLQFTTRYFSIKSALGVCLLAVLAACQTQQTSLRRIELAGAGPATAALGRNMQTLLNATNTSYVTLGVFDRVTGESQEAGVPSEIATSGSGFVLDASRGLIVTAAHVAITPGWVTKARGPDGRLYAGRVLRTAPKLDTALIKLTSNQGLKTVSLAPTACLKPGTPVFSLGKPSKRGDVARIGTVASMSFGRPVNYHGYGYPDAMVVRFKTEKGESGGPLFDDQGRLVGMIVSTVTDNTGRKLGLAHALPLTLLARAICSKTSCPADWQPFMTQTVRSCPAG